MARYRNIRSDLDFTGVGCWSLLLIFWTVHPTWNYHASFDAGRITLAEAFLTADAVLQTLQNITEGQWVLSDLDPVDVGPES